MGQPKPVQRSFRLSRATSDLLDATAEATGERRNALADRLLGEGVRLERHPLIRFRTGAAGRREPLLVGTRLLVRQVVATAGGEGGDVEAAAETLGLPVRAVRAAVAYYAEFRDEIDRDAEWAARIEAAERSRWDREQAALA
jgi:uncharacterized protein (DUF433 family)